MYLFCFGTRPELIKLIPLIMHFKENNVNFQTLFTGQHETLINDFLNYIEKPNFYFNDIMEHGQSLNKLISKIIFKFDEILHNEKYDIIIQGDTTSTLAIALASFYKKFNIIHIEAGLRTFDIDNPYPEEMNRTIISNLSNLHFCPSEQSMLNLENQGIKKNKYLVGNTIVDAFNYFLKNSKPNNIISNLISNNKHYIICTLHRNENRQNIIKLWEQINKLAIIHNYIKFIYIKHPSLNYSNKYLSENINIIEPINYIDMVHLINNCIGIITDSGGIQEEALCCNKNILICRTISERSEIIDCGLGKLVNHDIINNFNFLLENKKKINLNPLGENVSKQIYDVLKNL